MKAGRNSLLWRYRYLFLAMIAVLCCGISAYHLFFVPQIPECRAVMRATYQLEGKAIQRILLVSVVPEGRRRVSVLLSGSFFDGDTRYTIERALVLDYQREGKNYTLRLKESVRKPQDNLENEDLNRRLPMSAPLLHWRIEKIDERHYLFSGNHAPLFVCATTF
ncbi:hypothetical protein [Serratia ureilytica]|uniref:hypothetical protein n=1 Tax=Serratia ureilytica TaxID=300181 RepID=UPI001D18AEC6|nr:hypothetical protein [Serratia ureilytica]MCC4106627.1 hypothetical protein [Serratia ureilytica]